MSMPSVPEMNVNREDAINLILSSIGMEELSLAHIVNAEAEKIQFALGTLSTATEAASLDDILSVNASAKRMLRDVIKNQMLISMKMEDTVDLALQEVATADSDLEPEEAQPESEAEAQPEPEVEEAPPEEDPEVAAEEA